MRSRNLICRAGSTHNTAPSRDMGAWLDRQIRDMQPVPEAYFARCDEMRYAAYNASGNHGAAFTDEASRCAIREALTELLDEMRESLRLRQYALDLYDICCGDDMPYTRAELVEMLDQAERDSLAFDMARN
jgi:hypothetical protein